MYVTVAVQHTVTAEGAQDATRQQKLVEGLKVLGRPQNDGVQCRPCVSPTTVGALVIASSKYGSTYSYYSYSML